ncbi:MAG: RluA family pseudouridine synthase [Firmicutes bacterium]|uniref:RNA pseudouridylate synthase n=1 Tax=Candidatus Gallilactobacillus intestinavium TaxID=2840838 RepID=A0A9D9H838_9LACO|nr:RluA family pseudouridine synthase [Candidatus Gallilactobacillus intestinavium]
MSKIETPSFRFVYKKNYSIVLKKFLNNNGVSHSVLKDIRKYKSGLFVNGHNVYDNFQLHKGDVIDLVLPPECSNRMVMISDDDLNICYEDDNVLIINKEAGVASIPSKYYSNDTLVNRVKGYLINNGCIFQIPHIVTRLDKGTSGLVIFAKNKLMHAFLSNRVKSNLVKEYYALVEGNGLLNHGFINAPIGRDPNSIIKRQVINCGKSSYTEYWLLGEFNNKSLVKIRLHSGRTHQIRVHFSYIGHPLVNDLLYGGKDYGIRYQALTCYKVTFNNVFDNEKISIKINLPQQISNLIY